MDAVQLEQLAGQVTHWLAVNPGKWRAAEVGAGAGVKQDYVTSALRFASKRGLVRAKRPAGVAYYAWGATRRGVKSFEDKPLEAKPKPPIVMHVTGAQQRGARLARWLAVNPGWHAEAEIARWFLLSRFDLQDALDAAERLGLIEWRAGAYGLREWTFLGLSEEH